MKIRPPFPALPLRHCLVALLLVTAAGCNAQPRSPAGSSLAEPDAARVPLEISTRSGVRRFDVEIARTPDEQAQGLMYRTALPADEGMVFPFVPPRPASFWMKNTYIPLDIIFIRADGTIANIAENTIPQSLEPVTSNGEPVAAVLEIAGGRTAELGIAAGDRVVWNDPAAEPAR